MVLPPLPVPRPDTYGGLVSQRRKDFLNGAIAGALLQLLYPFVLGFLK
jgi:hypothetical protein